MTNSQDVRGHTKGEWWVSEAYWPPRINAGPRIGPGGCLIAEVGNAEDDHANEWIANANRIVHCVNVHDELVDALEAVTPKALGYLPVRVAEQIRAALSKARQQ